MGKSDDVLVKKHMKLLMQRWFEQSNSEFVCSHGISNELVFNIVADKFLSNVLLVGINFNAIFAKTMIWRLGILFSMLSARRGAIDDYIVKDTTKLICLVFSQTDALKFQQPTYPTFEKLISFVMGNSIDQFNDKIAKALEAVDE